MKKFNVYYEFEEIFKQGVTATDENEAEALVLAAIYDSIVDAVKSTDFSKSLLKVRLCEVTDME